MTVDVTEIKKRSKLVCFSVTVKYHPRDSLLYCGNGPLINTEVQSQFCGINTVNGCKTHKNNNCSLSCKNKLAARGLYGRSAADALQLTDANTPDTQFKDG